MVILAFTVSPVYSPAIIENAAVQKCLCCFAFWCIAPICYTLIGSRWGCHCNSTHNITCQLRMKNSASVISLMLLNNSKLAKQFRKIWVHETNRVNRCQRMSSNVMQNGSLKPSSCNTSLCPSNRCLYNHKLHYNVIRGCKHL